MKEQWVESIYRQFQRGGVPFFFKQWGGVRKDMTGGKVHGLTYDEMPCLTTIEPAVDTSRKDDG
jgi:protein gp37